MKTTEEMEESREKTESRSTTKSINFNKENQVQYKTPKTIKMEEVLGLGKEEVASSSESHFWTLEKQMRGN